MIEERKQIQHYFAKRVACYEEAYSRVKSRGLRKTIYRLGWFPLRLIFKHTMEYLAGVKPGRVLDIGCGSGVYSVELAKQGIAVTGIDSCKEMIDATKILLEENGLDGRVQTVLADYLDWSKENGQEYDLALAIGVLDYTRDAGAYLASFRHNAGEVIATFPARSMFSFIADFSYRQQGISGYFYDKPQMRTLLHKSGLEIVSFTKIFPSTYWVHARRSHVGINIQ